MFVYFVFCIIVASNGLSRLKATVYRELLPVWADGSGAVEQQIIPKLQ